MLRTASSLPRKGLLTLSSDPARFQAEPPACYRASWQLPGPDFHRQATTSLRTRRNTMALRHGVTSRSAGRTNNPQWGPSMSFRARFVAAAALATAGFLLAPAVAQAATHPVQVTGTKLKSALLRASAFGPDWEWDY